MKTIKEDERLRKKRFLNKEAYIDTLKYFIIFILILGYTTVVSSKFAPDFVFKKSNLIMYGFGDLFILIFSNVSIFTIPVLILYFFIYKTWENTTNVKAYKSSMLREVAKILIYLFVLYLAVLLAYILARGDNPINFGYSDRSSLSFVMPVYYAIGLTLLYNFFYILVFSNIARILENIVKKSWLAILVAIILSFIDTKMRMVFYTTDVIGILPSDNVVVFYMTEPHKHAERSGYWFSILYWIIIATILYAVLIIIYKKKSQRIKAASR